METCNHSNSEENQCALCKHKPMKEGKSLSYTRRSKVQKKAICRKCGNVIYKGAKFPNNFFLTILYRVAVFALLFFLLVEPFDNRNYGSCILITLSSVTAIFGINILPFLALPFKKWTVSDSDLLRSDGIRGRFKGHSDENAEHVCSHRVDSVDVVYTFKDSLVHTGGVCQLCEKIVYKNNFDVGYWFALWGFYLFLFIVAYVISLHNYNVFLIICSLIAMLYSTFSVSLFLSFQPTMKESWQFEDVSNSSDDLQ